MQGSLPCCLQDFVDRNWPSASAVSSSSLVSLTQQGRIRSGPDKPWMELRATQTINPSAVGFKWNAWSTMMGCIPVSVVDQIDSAGKGSLVVKIFNILTVVNGKGPHFDIGEAQRYLSELPWCPLAFVHNPHIAFNEEEASSKGHSTTGHAEFSKEASARKTITCWWKDHPEAFVNLHLDDAGDIVGVSTPARFREGTGNLPWGGRFWDYREFEGGMRCPAKAEVWWEAPEGKFTYFEGEITSIAVVD